MLVSPDRLNRRARKLVESKENELYLSAASAFEIGIKHACGKLKLPGKPESSIPEMMQKSAVTALPITLSHALRAGSLPGHHRDPFDRLLIAQAQIEKLPILTADPRIDDYDVRVIAAA